MQKSVDCTPPSPTWFVINGSIMKRSVMNAVCFEWSIMSSLLWTTGLRSRRFLGGVGVGFLTALGVRVGVGDGFFYPIPTPEVQLDHIFTSHS